MNWIDNLIGFISPEKGYERAMWRKGFEEVRSYDAGDHGRLNAGWHSVNDSAEITDRYQRDVVRARARDLERNSDMANAVIGAYKRNIIGAGFSLQARTGDDKVNDQIEHYWKKWCKKRNCDVTETQSFTQMLRMLEERKRVDGGMLIHKVFMPGGVIPFKLQCIEVDELDVTQSIPHTQGNKVVGGIEYNSYNKAIGYWIKRYSIDGYDVYNPVYVEAKDMIFVFTKKRPSQVREISDMSPTITRIRDANEFMVAVSVKERIEACLSVFIKKQTPVSSIGRSGSGPAEDKYNYDGKTLTPGMIKYLNPGDDVVTVNPAGQATDAVSYMKLQQRLMGAGQGISYEATARDMSETNYASARQANIEDDLTYAEDVELIMEVMDEIYETFVISLYLAGLVEMKNFWNRKEEFLNHEWIKAPKRWIDPLKESTSNKTALATGQKTFKQIAAETGHDWKEQINDIAEVVAYGRSKGVEMGGVMFGKEYETEVTDSDGEKEKPDDKR